MINGGKRGLKFRALLSFKLLYRESVMILSGQSSEVGRWVAKSFGAHFVLDNLPWLVF